MVKFLERDDLLARVKTEIETDGTVRKAAAEASKEAFFLDPGLTDEPMRTWLDMVYDSVQSVCEDLAYRAVRVDPERVDPMLADDFTAILETVEASAFVVADLTQVRPSDLYTLGHANGLGKPAIVIARTGTELPFPLADSATAFWEPDDMLSFRERLWAKVSRIAWKAGAD